MMSQVEVVVGITSISCHGNVELHLTSQYHNVIIQQRLNLLPGNKAILKSMFYFQKLENPKYAICKNV
jgi:hypothetical protein